MRDMVIKGTGNSRFLKSVSNFLTLYPSYSSFVSALVAGTLPIDLNGLNNAGIQTQGTPNNKANLLTDATAALYGLGTDASVNDVLARIGFYGEGTFTAAGWSDTAPYTQTINVTGMPADAKPGWDINTSSTDGATLEALKEARGCIAKIVCTSGQVTAYCGLTKPTIDLPVFFKGA